MSRWAYFGLIISHLYDSLCIWLMIITHCHKKWIWLDLFKLEWSSANGQATPSKGTCKQLLAIALLGWFMLLMDDLTNTVSIEILKSTVRNIKINAFNWLGFLYLECRMVERGRRRTNVDDGWSQIRDQGGGLLVMKFCLALKSDH